MAAARDPNELSVEAGLGEPPAGEHPAPPVETAEQLLPFVQLRWDDFEKLCYRLARDTGDVEHTQRFGTAGQDQSGIDIYSRRSDGTYITYQSKKYETVADGLVKDAVDTFLNKRIWAERSSCFVLCTTASLVRIQRAEAIEAQKTRLAEHEPPIEFVVWDAEQLSTLLTEHPELVREFFGPVWHRRFCQLDEPAAVAEQMEALVHEVRNVAGRSLTARVVFVDDIASKKLRDRVRDVSQQHPEEFAALTTAVGGIPPDVSLLTANIDARPDWAMRGGVDLWALLAHMAENAGEWTAAVDAWEVKASMETGYDRAGSLVSAAACAGVAEDLATQERLLEEAAAEDENHPRLRLERLDEDAEPADQLAALEAIETDDSRALVLIEARQAIASLMLPDLQRAKHHLAELERLDPDSFAAKVIAINTTVQEGRLAVVHSVPLDASALQSASEAAMGLRAQLLTERRRSEAARLLMLAADAVCLLEDRATAGAMLRQATDGERHAHDGPVVLAACASDRVLDPRLALEFLEGQSDDDPGVRRIRAESLERVGTVQERAEALQTLDALVQDDGDEAPEAAFVRLAASLGRRPTPWSDAAFDYLMSQGHERAAVTAKVVYLTRLNTDWDEAQALLAPYADERWAKATRLRVALQRGKLSEMRAAADDLVAAGGTQTMRLDAAEAYVGVEEYQLAEGLLVDLAREPSAPVPLRYRAYGLLMKVVGNAQQNWQYADELLVEWEALTPTDPNAGAWRVLVANRLRQRPESPG